MKSTTARTLSERLVDFYEPLRNRLNRRTGSRDLSMEALHETWIKLQEGRSVPENASEAYLYRALINTATDLVRSDRKHIGHADIDEILSLADDTPDQERTVSARQELAHIRKALSELTRRQSHVFVKFFGDGASLTELSQQHGVSVRTLEIDLRRAVLHCAQRTARIGLTETGALRVSGRKRG